MARSLKLEDLTKSNIWTISESELHNMLLDGKKKEGYSDNESRYMNIIRSVFDLQYFDRDDEEKTESLKQEQYELFYAPNEGEFNAIAIRKRKINKITDLTLENITHLSPEDILSLIDKNMGTGWNGLPLALQDIIESAFYIDVSQLPEATMHRKGGIIDRRKSDGYEVLEIPRGSWIEAIFIKPKPKMEKIHFSYNDSSYSDEEDQDDDLDDDSLDVDDEEDVTPNVDSDEDDEDQEESEPSSIEEIDVIDESEEEEEDD